MEDKNQIIRDNLEKSEEDGEIVFELPVDLNSLSIAEKSYYMMAEQVLFMDLFKQLYYQLRIQNITEDSLVLLPWLDGVREFRDIHKNFIQEPDLLCAAMDAVHNFTCATSLEKFAQVKSLPEEKKKFLSKICPTFKDDLEIYDKEVTLEDYYKYASDIDAFYTKEKLAYYKESIELQIASFIQSLYFYDQKNCIDTILRLAIRDYIWSNEWIKHNKDLSSNYVQQMALKKLRRIHFIQQSETEEIISRALSDFTYLNEILDTYLTVRGKYASEEELEEKENKIVQEGEVKEKIKTMKEKLNHRIGVKS